MTATIIDGRAVAERIRAKIAEQVQALKDQHGIHPGLAVVLIGDNQASATYVRMKRRACGEAGINSFAFELPAAVSQAEVETLITELNARDDVHGILIQLPLPAHLDEAKILGMVNLDKDVDGFHSINIGRLAMKGLDPTFVPATPTGVIRLLDEYNVPLAGANAVVLGRSNIVGMPVSLLLVKRDATVTICHSRTKDLPGVIRQADVLIAAVGRPKMVKADWLKPGVVVIDVGTTPIPDPANPGKNIIVGDVDFESAKEVASMITPVPKGVGPMTIAMLLENTLKSAQMRVK